jgi:hypothetical protein
MERLWTGRTGLGIELGLVQVVENILDGLGSTIPSGLSVPPFCSCGTHCPIRDIHLKVTSDEELTSHVCGLCTTRALEAIVCCIE